jgi:hypothetical protein
MKNVFIAAVLITVAGCIHPATSGTAAPATAQDPLPENGIIFEDGRTAVDEKVLHVMLVGDPQFNQKPRTPEFLKIAMADIAAIPHDFMVVLGDLVQNRSERYRDYTKGVLDRATKPVYSLPGNGDVGAGLRAYQDSTGFPLYYGLRYRGIRFLFLGTLGMTGKGKHICILGDKQITWLEEQLDRDRKTTTIVFSHAPVFETTWHSEDRSDKKFPGSMFLGESDKVRALLKKHDNVVIFAHGHLHHPWPRKDEHGRGAFHLEDGVLHVSVAASANNQGSALMSVEKSRILIRVRDHANNKWLDKFDRFHEVKTTLDHVF